MIPSKHALPRTLHGITHCGVQQQSVQHGQTQWNNTADNGVDNLQAYIEETQAIVFHRQGEKIPWVGEQSVSRIISA